MSYYVTGDFMLFTELQAKDVISLTNGNKIGRIKDFDIDIDNGTILSIHVRTNSRVRSFFQGEEVLMIPWQKIVKMGGEVIIVNFNSQER